MNKITTVEYPEVWPIHDWSGIVLGSDDFNPDAIVGVGDAPEQHED